MYKDFVLLIVALSFAIDRRAQSEPEKASELRVVDSHTVFLRATKGLRRLSPDGGWVEDRMHIQTETGEIGLDKNARPPDEINLAIGEQASNELGHGGSTFKLLAITRELSLFISTSI